LSEQRSIQYGFNPVGFRDIPGITPPNNLVAQGVVGTVTVDVSGTSDVIDVTGVTATGAVGSVTIIDDAGTFDSTNETLDSTAQTYDEG
jgi:hypothetical protein